MSASGRYVYPLRLSIASGVLASGGFVAPLVVHDFAPALQSSSIAVARHETADTVTLVPPDFFPKALFDSLGTVTGPPLDGVFRRDIVVVDFRLHTRLAARQAAIDSIGGLVVGGFRYASFDDGGYYVRIQGGSTAALVNALQILHRQPQVAMATWWELSRRNENARPGQAGFRHPTSP